MELHLALKLSWLRALAALMYSACCRHRPSMVAFLVRAARPLAALFAFTASNSACSQVAVSPEGGGGAAATVTVTGLVTVPAALLAVRV
jgi:hypothetical protein